MSKCFSDDFKTTDNAGDWLYIFPVSITRKIETESDIIKGFDTKALRAFHVPPQGAS